MSSSLCPRVHDGCSELDGAALPRGYQQQHGALGPSLSHLCESPEVPSTAPAWQGEGVTAGFACHELPTLLSISALGPGRDGASCSWHRRSSPPGAEPSAWQGQPHLLGRRQKLGNLPAFLQLSGWRHHPVAPRGLLCVCTKRRDKGTLLPHRPRHPAQPSPRICCPCTGLLTPQGLGGVVPQLSGGLGLPCQGVIVAETNCSLHHISLLENLFPSHPRIRSHRTFVCRSRETGKQVLPWCGEGGTGKLSECPKKASLSQPPSPAALLGTCVQESSAGSSGPPGHRARAKHPGPLSPGMLRADRALADGVAHGGTKDFPEQFGQGLPRHDTLPVVVLLFSCSLRAR